MSQEYQSSSKAVDWALLSGYGKWSNSSFFRRGSLVDRNDEDDRKGVPLALNSPSPQFPTSSGEESTRQKQRNNQRKEVERNLCGEAVYFISKDFSESVYLKSLHFISSSKVFHML